MTRSAPQDNGPERKDFLTARQLAKILQVSESTVRKLAQHGRIPCIRLTPRLLRFNLTAVRHALDVANRNRSRDIAAESTHNDAQLSFDDLM